MAELAEIKEGREELGEMLEPASRGARSRYLGTQRAAARFHPLQLKTKHEADRNEGKFWLPNPLAPKQ